MAKVRKDVYPVRVPEPWEVEWLCRNPTVIMGILGEHNKTPLNWIIFHLVIGQYPDKKNLTKYNFSNNFFKTLKNNQL